MATTADEVWQLLGELIQAQKETERRFQETERLIKEQNRQLNQQLGKLGNRLGEFVAWQAASVGWVDARKPNNPCVFTLLLLRRTVLEMDVGRCDLHF